ncbi:MAG: EAL domain-containing protein [Oscillibacter sp.]|nr:EAL domain-containing protein [Oscillibacter sp.]
MKELKITKRIATALICAAIALSCAVVSILATASGDTLTVGVPTDRCPVIYRDADTGEITGIGADLMRAAAKEAGYAVTFKAIEEGTLKEALDNAAYNVVMPFGSAIVSASGRSTVVSDNLTQTPFTLVTENSGELPSLNELRVGMLRSLSGAAETVRLLYPGIRITLYDTMSECVKALRAGEVDALLHNSYVWSYILQKPAYSGLSVQPSAMFSMDFRAGALDTITGRAVIARLNDGIAALTDTRRQAVVLDHTSRRLYRYDLSDYLYEYGLILLLGTLLFVSLLVISVMKWRAFRLEHEKKMRYLIDHDPLTGALSLKGFRKRAEELLRAHPEIPYLISYNNIKNFKFINDSLGMEAGDVLLRFWADKFMEALSDMEAIGRIEGDHFVVLRRVGGDEKMRRDEETVFHPVRNFFIDRGQEQRVQICSGVYILTQRDYQQIDIDHMLDFARVAEQRVRETRKDGYEFYNPEQWEKGKRDADIVGHLTAAIQSGKIQVFYQPQVNYDTDEITGMEALCRWNHAKLGWLRPSEFIPTLEEAGLIYELDCFVWEKACQDLHRWNEAGKRRAISVNLSRRDIQSNQNIPGHFYNLIQTYHLDAEQLRIEITETAYAEDSATLIETTEKLREFGFPVEMDDFGSGYSSLHMLKEAPIDRIKLDLNFLSGAGDPEKGRIIVGYMIQMAHSLGINMIAEGVENAAQARFLQSRGCSEMQGFYFYKPMSLEEFERIAEKAESSDKAQ